MSHFEPKFYSMKKKEKCCLESPPPGLPRHDFRLLVFETLQFEIRCYDNFPCCHFCDSLSLTRACRVAASRGGQGRGSLIPKMLAYVPGGFTVLSIFLQFLTPLLIKFLLALMDSACCFVFLHFLTAFLPLCVSKAFTAIHSGPVSLCTGWLWSISRGGFEPSAPSLDFFEFSWVIPRVRQSPVLRHIQK